MFSHAWFENKNKFQFIIRISVMFYILKNTELNYFIKPACKLLQPEHQDNYTRLY